MVLKSQATAMEKKFLELCTTIAGEIDLEIYDLSYIKGSQTLKVFVEDPKTGTALIEDCMRMDRALTPSIDELEWIPEALVLEVSSPGMFRELNKVLHFNAVLDEQIMVQTSKKIEEFTDEKLSKKNLSSKKTVGILREVTEEGISLEMYDKDNKVILKLDYKDIKKANLEPIVN